MASTLYLGEAAGARIFRVGSGLVRPTADDVEAYALDVLTWDLLPAGEVGDVSFRTIDVALRITNGLELGITPIIDGVEEPEQYFSYAGTQEVEAQAFVARRGTRIAARVRTLALTGLVELHNIAASFFVLRKTP